MLDNTEREFLNAYHKNVYEKLSPQLNDEEKAWLLKATQEV
jgi:Xaa-Pro aminopeptidase